MRRILIVSVVGALLLLLAAACQKQARVVTASCLDRFTDVAPTPSGRTLLRSAIDIANQILDAEKVYRLAPGWEPVAADNTDTARKIIPVHAVAADPGGRYSLAFVPEGSDCILVDTSVATAAVDRLVNPESRKESAFPNESVVAHFLLHELGHIIDRPAGSSAGDTHFSALCRELMLAEQPGHLSSPANNTCTRVKASEIAADRFAAGQIRRAWESGNTATRVEAGYVQMALAAMAIHIIADRAGAGRSRNPGPDVFCDSGFSHPNFELRLLYVFGLLNHGRSWTLRRALEQRNSGCSGMSAAPAKEDQLQKYMNMPTRELLLLLDTATNYEKIDLVTALSERKEKAVVDAVAKIAALPDVPNPEAAADLRTLRAEAVHALGMLGDQGVLPVVTARLGSTAVSEQMAAAYALGRLAVPSSVPSLIAHADPGNSLFYRSVIDALGDIGGREAVNFLEKVRQTDPLHGEAASKSLSRISERAAGGKPG